MLRKKSVRKAMISVVAILLVGLLLLSLVAQAFASPSPSPDPSPSVSEPGDGDTPSSTTTTGKWHQYKGGASPDTMATSIDQAGNLLDTALQDPLTDIAGIDKAVKALALYLITLDSVYYNGSSGSGFESTSYDALVDGTERLPAKNLLEVLGKTPEDERAYIEKAKSAVTLINSKIADLEGSHINGITCGFSANTYLGWSTSNTDGIFLSTLQSIVKDYISYRFLFETRDYVIAYASTFEEKFGADSVMSIKSESATAEQISTALDALFSKQGADGAEIPSNDVLALFFLDQNSDGYNTKRTALTSLYTEIVTNYNTSTKKVYGGYTPSSETKKYPSCHYDGRSAQNDIETHADQFLLRMANYKNTTDSPGSNIQNEGVNDYDVTQGALSLVSNAKLDGGKIVLSGTDAALTDIGYAVLAAGVVYDPFVSLAGNDNFLAVLRTFVEGSDKKQDELVKVLQQALHVKKPLQVTEGSNTEWTNAESLQGIEMAKYRQARLADVLQVDQDITRAYVMIKGGMSPSQVDSSTWDYANYGTTADVKDNSYTVENPGASAEPDSSSSSGSGSPYITTGNDNATMSKHQTTEPIMITSGVSGGTHGVNSTEGYAAAVGGLTSIILHNAALDAKDNLHIKNAEQELLFVNGLGDVVLADDTIILPAVSNPVNYVYNDEYEGVEDDDFIDTFGKEDSEYKGYYPYNIAFMNHYAGGKVNSEGKLRFDDETSMGKYMILVDGGTLFAKNIISMSTGFSKSYLGIAQTGGVRIATICGKSFSVTDDVEETTTALFAARGDIGTQLRNWAWSGLSVFSHLFNFISGNDHYQDGTDGWNAGERENAVFILRGLVANKSGQTMFPLTPGGADIRDSYVEVATPIVTSALRFLSDKTDGEGTTTRTSTGHFQVEHYVMETMGEALLGTQYADTLVKNYQVSYDDLVKDSGNRFLKFLTDITDNAISFLGTIDGVLAIKGPYSNGFFNAILNFVQEFYLLIVICLLIIVAAKFLKGHYNLLYVCFIAAMCFAGFEVYANWLPTALPSIYGFAVNDVIEDVVWNTVLYKAECYDETYKQPTHVDTATGALKPYTATITLYRLTSAEMEIVAARSNVDIKDLKTGKAVYLDHTAGIFAQGNEIKMSIDSLLKSNTMRGLYQSQWDYLGANVTESPDFIPPVEDVGMKNPYSLQLTSPLVSLEAYYTPYNHIERAFLMQLNTLASIFRMERHAYNYGDGELYKDAFLVRSFLNSGIFIAPGDDEVLKENIVTGSIVAEEDGTGITVDMFVDVCNRYFTPQDDWLNLRAIFAKPDDGIQDSLWGHILQSRGYYDYYWNMTKEGQEYLSDLLVYVNNQTKLWVMRNLENLSFCSDENAVKMISLYATTCFTHYVSEFGSWLYPNYINASDIALKDVLYGAMTTIKDRNFAYDGTAVNTVALNLGVFGVLFLLIITLFASVFVFTITYLIPILYALFGAILVFKLVNDDTGIGLVKGYVKVTLSTAVLYFLFSCSLQLVRIGGYNWYGFLGCALVMILCMYFLFWVVLSVVQDVGELGNNTLAHNLLQGLKGLSFGAVQRVQNASIGINNVQRNRVFGRGIGVNQYGRGYSIDDYGRPYASRGGFSFGRGAQQSAYGGGDFGGRYEGYGRESYYDEYDNARPRSRVQRVFNGAANAVDGVQSWRRRRSSRATTSSTTDTSDTYGGRTTGGG